MKHKKQLLVLLLLIISFLFVSVGSSYAIFSYTKKGETISKLTTGVYQVPLIPLNEKILQDNILITTAPTLTTSSNNTSDESGLYKSTATNDGSPTYYFRGNVENNYVSFAGQTWRVVRINEDGTIRMIMSNGINDNTGYVFNSSYNNYIYIYYTNSKLKTTLEEWYNTNLSSYNDKIASGNYFCEQAKVKFETSSSGSATTTLYSSYTPDFKCKTDGNGKGIVNSNIGLITYDEIVYAGGYVNQSNNNYYLYNNTSYWTMLPSGYVYGYSYIWIINDATLTVANVTNALLIYPIINLKADTIVIGSGTSADPYVVQ